MGDPFTLNMRSSLRGQRGCEACEGMTGLNEADDGGRRPRDFVGEGSLEGEGGREFGRVNPAGRTDDGLCDVGVAVTEAARWICRICES